MHSTSSTRLPHALASLALGLTLGLCLMATMEAQSCGTGRTLLKNDRLPAVPTGASTFAIVPGLCQGEAAMSLFDAGGPVKVHEVSILFANSIGTNGIRAAVDVEIYDGATVDSIGKWTLGKLLFKLSNHSTNLQIQTTALNTYKLPKPVRVPSGKPVIGFRMILNTSGGSCATGYNSNFAVDPSVGCKKGINILDALNHGPIDPMTYMGFGVGMCPLFFNGSWIIRACVEPEVSVQWTGNATPGGVVSLTYLAPGEAGNSYYALMSGGTTPGFNSPWGYVPLNFDVIMDCFIGACGSVLVGRQGVIGINGTAAGGLILPNLPVLKNSGLTLYAGFVTFKGSNFNTWISVSSPSRAIVIN